MKTLFDDIDFNFSTLQNLKLPKTKPENPTPNTVYLDNGTLYVYTEDNEWISMGKIPAATKEEIGGFRLYNPIVNYYNCYFVPVTKTEEDGSTQNLIIGLTSMPTYVGDYCFSSKPKVLLCSDASLSGDEKTAFLNLIKFKQWGDDGANMYGSVYRNYYIIDNTDYPHYTITDTNTEGIVVTNDDSTTTTYNYDTASMPSEIYGIKLEDGSIYWYLDNSYNSSTKVWNGNSISWKFNLYDSESDTYGTDWENALKTAKNGALAYAGIIDSRVTEIIGSSEKHTDDGGSEGESKSWWELFYSLSGITIPDNAEIYTINLNDGIDPYNSLDQPSVNNVYDTPVSIKLNSQNNAYIMMPTACYRTLSSTHVCDKDYSANSSDIDINTCENYFYTEVDGPNLVDNSNLENSVSVFINGLPAKYNEHYLLSGNYGTIKFFPLIDLVEGDVVTFLADTITYIPYKTNYPMNNSIWNFTTMNN